MKVYLAGPINGCTDDEAIGWREKPKDLLRCETLDNMSRDYRGKELDNFREIVEGDKYDIDSCDAMLVYYEKPSVGTSMEVLWAWLNHTPVHVATEQKNLSPWLLYHATSISTLEEACEKINESASRVQPEILPS